MDDNDEKPILACEPCSEKLPMVLSGENVDPPIQVPASITQYLRDYQLKGVRFLYERFKANEGGILADDMGLGKTIQAIAFVAALLKMRGTKEDKLRHCTTYIRNYVAPGIEMPSVDPVLIICPASLTDNWIYELQTWGHFKVSKITSNNRVELINQAQRRECDVLIVTFDTARSIIDDLNAVDWTCILVDEVHRIKDTNSQISKALCSLRCKHRYGFTGTPFQNNIKEVWCLLKWSNPQAANSLNNEANDISRLVEQGLQRNATKRDSVEKSLAQLKFSALRQKLMLRRTKEILAKHLPPKTDEVVFCELTDVQKNIYRAITESINVQNLLGDNECQDKNAKKKKTGLLFSYLHLLQKTANHVALLASGLSSRTNEVSKNVCLEALEKFGNLDGIPQKRWFSALADFKMSGKMLVLFQLLSVFLKKGDKVLIFSYSTKVLDLVQKHLSKERYKFWRLDGTTPPGTRLGLVSSFNSNPDPAVFLLSTKAGGVGLNITGANVVIIFDPNWNPAHDLQAQDRAYRLGQQRPVRVYRLLSTSTIEEFVYLRQVYKQQLGTASMTDKNARRYFNRELFGVKNLFSFREHKRSLTAEILEKQHKLEFKLCLKLEAPSTQEFSDVYFSPCAVATGSNAMRRMSHVIDSKSGLIQLFEDVFETSCDQIAANNECWNDNDLEEEDDGENQNEDVNGSVRTLLEKTGVVRHVVQHHEVVAPSKVEDFVSDCAIRDIFQRGMDSQLPVFDCSVGTLDSSMSKEETGKPKSSIPTISRLKFCQIAENEFLTPYQLATKVVAMSDGEKMRFLKKHQVKHQERSAQESRVKKQVKLSSGPSKEKCTTEDERPRKQAEILAGTKTLPCKKSSEMLNINVKGKPPLGSSDPVSSESHSHQVSIINDAKSSNQSSQSSESSSSFEKETSLLCPELSKDAISLMKRLVCNQTIKTRHEDTHDEISPKGKCFNTIDLSDEASTSKCEVKGRGKSEVSHCAMDKNRNDEDRGTLHPTSDAGCSVGAMELIDSLFFSSTVKKPSPKKRSHSPSVNIGASTAKLFRQGRNCEEATLPLNNDSDRVDSVLNSTIFRDFPPKASTKFRAEDDVFINLVKAGKLKRL